MKKEFFFVFILIPFFTNAQIEKKDDNNKIAFIQIYEKCPPDSICMEIVYIDDITEEKRDKGYMVSTSGPRIVENPYPQFLVVLNNKFNIYLIKGLNKNFSLIFREKTTNKVTYTRFFAQKNDNNLSISNEESVGKIKKKIISNFETKQNEKTTKRLFSKVIDKYEFILQQKN